MIVSLISNQVRWNGISFTAEEGHFHVNIHELHKKGIIL